MGNYVSRHRHPIGGVVSTDSFVEMHRRHKKNIWWWSTTIVFAMIDREATILLDVLPWNCEASVLALFIITSQCAHVTAKSVWYSKMS
jgi:hypothetical protein